MLSYTVAVTFANQTQVDAWLHWLREGHIADVMAGGAAAAEIVQMDTPALTYEVRYRFPSRDAFAAYERDFAPRLRAEGLRLFPTDQGISYRRSVGMIVGKF